MKDEKTGEYRAVNVDLALGETFWNDYYKANKQGWDLGEVSPPLKAYSGQLKDKNLRILIPGCGNTYEAEYLLQEGFTDITVIDIAPALVNKLQEKYRGNSNIQIVLGDFFEHEGAYDLILEQTFFCALHPSLRKPYVARTKGLLTESGKLAGVLFNKEFDKQGPPFGGSKHEYKTLFENDFELKVMTRCYNSFPKRRGSELFIIFRRKQ